MLAGGLLTVALALFAPPRVRVPRTASRSCGAHARYVPPPPPTQPTDRRLLRRGAVIEVWHAGGLCTGNYRGRAPPPSKALVVELDDGSTIRVDSGQVVDVWAYQTAAVPEGTAEWAEVHKASAELLRRLPTHFLDLSPLWKRLLAAKRGARLVRTDAAAEAIFGAVDDLTGPAASTPASERAVAVRRVAAGQLLADEQVLFKHLPVTLSAADDADDRDMMIVDGGGFRPLSRAQADSLAERALTAGLEAVRRGETVAWGSSQVRDRCVITVRCRLITA